MSRREHNEHAVQLANKADLRSLARGLRRTETYFRLMTDIHPERKRRYLELLTPCQEAAAVLELTFRQESRTSRTGLLNGTPEATSRALRARREELRMGRPELAQRAGVSRGTIRNLETGLCIPTTQTLERLLKALYPEGKPAPSTDSPFSQTGGERK